jgi:hypothetical protein
MWRSVIWQILIEVQEVGISSPETLVSVHHTLSHKTANFTCVFQIYELYQHSNGLLHQSAADRHLPTFVATAMPDMTPNYLCGNIPA